jgi:hypothetical protein
MDLVYSYLWLALYYGFYYGFLISFVILMGYFLWHKQWLFTLLSIGFSFMYGGFLLALVIGWQEANNWKIKNFMRVYTILLVVFFIMGAKTLFTTLTTASPPVDPKVQAKQKAAARHK